MASFSVSDRAAGATGSEEIVTFVAPACVLTSVTSSFIITMMCEHVSSTTRFSETRLRWLALTVEVARPLMSKLERVKREKAENFMVALV